MNFNLTLEEIEYLESRPLNMLSSVEFRLLLEYKRQGDMFDGVPIGGEVD